LPDTRGGEDGWKPEGFSLAHAFKRFEALQVKAGSAERCEWAEWMGQDFSIRTGPPLDELIVRALDAVAQELILRSSEPKTAPQLTRSWSALGAVARRLMRYDTIVSRLSGAPWQGTWFLAESWSTFATAHQALALLPLPRRLRENLHASGTSNVESLAQLLALVMSSPSHISRADYHFVADLVLLCAGAIVSPGSFIASGALRNGDEIADYAMRGLTAEALLWCAASLPTFKFDEQVEQAIRTAALLPAMQTRAGPQERLRGSATETQERDE
jgi:hypothetical protein